MMGIDWEEYYGVYDDDLADAVEEDRARAIFLDSLSSPERLIRAQEHAINVEYPKLVPLLEKCENYIDNRFVGYVPAHFYLPVDSKTNRNIAICIEPDKYQTNIFKYALNLMYNQNFELTKKEADDALHAVVVLPGFYNVKKNVSKTFIISDINNKFNKFLKKITKKNTFLFWHSYGNSLKNGLKYELIDDKSYKAFLKQKIRFFSGINDEEVLGAILTLILKSSKHIDNLSDIVKTILYFSKKTLDLVNAPCRDDWFSIKSSSKYDRKLSIETNLKKDEDYNLRFDDCELDMKYHIDSYIPNKDKNSRLYDDVCNKSCFEIIENCFEALSMKERIYDERRIWLGRMDNEPPPF